MGLLINPFYISEVRFIRILNGQERFLVENFWMLGGLKPFENLFVVDEYVGLDVFQSGHDHQTSKVDIYFDGKIFPDDKSFDHVLSTEVFEHVFELKHLLFEINRVLK